MLPEKAIREFKQLYKKCYGVDLNDKEASRRANNLVNIYKAVYSEPSFGKIQNPKRTSELNL